MMKIKVWCDMELFQTEWSEKHFSEEEIFKIKLQSKEEPAIQNADKAFQAGEHKIRAERLAGTGSWRAL